MRGVLKEESKLIAGLRVWLVIGVLGLGLTLGAQQVRANEGQFLLENVEGGSSRCVAMSVLVDTTYQMVVTCRQLIFPPEPPDIQRYILWAEGGQLRRPRKLGEIQRGKLYARVNQQFTNLFVTAERTNPTSPEGMVILAGALEPIDFKLTPTPIPTGSPTPTLEEATGAAEASPAARTGFLRTTGGKILVIVLSGFLIFAVIVAIFTRKA
jgi:hypothetical protein